MAIDPFSQANSTAGNTVPNAASDVTGALGAGTDPLTGFAARYNPAALQNVWSTPWSIIPDVYSGMNMAGPGYQSLRDIGGDPLTLYNIMAGSKSNLAGAGVGGYTNWLAGLYNSLGQVGGQQFNASELLKNLFHPLGGNANEQVSGNSANGGTQSALYNILTAGDASTQLRTLFNMARDASNVGMNPLAARGYQAALARTGDQAINQTMSTGAGSDQNNMPIYQLIRQLAPGLVP